MFEVIDYDTGETIEISQEEFEKQKQDLLIRWQNAAQNKAKFVADEKELRERIVCLTATPSKTKGSEFIPLPNNWSYKITKSIDYGFIKDFDTQKTDIDAIVEALSEIAGTLENGHKMASSLVTWKPQLSVSEYNKLTDEAREIIDKVIITKPGSVSLEIIPPKES